MAYDKEKKYIEASNLGKFYKLDKLEIPALNDVSFQIEKGEFVVVLGPSGAGKTTLLNLLGGMDSLTSGELVVDGKELKKFSDKDLTLYRRHDVGFVFQFYNLMPNLTAKENIELATEICKDAIDSMLVLQQVGLQHKAGNFPSQLSGGEQQRVSIARALAKNPKLVLCDEPTGALDYKTGKQILQLLNDVARKDRRTVIIVTHNSALKHMADKVIFIKNGTVERIELNNHPISVKDIQW